MSASLRAFSPATCRSAASRRRRATSSSSPRERCERGNGNRAAEVELRGSGQALAIGHHGGRQPPGKLQEEHHRIVREVLSRMSVHSRRLFRDWIIGWLRESCQKPGDELHVASGELLILGVGFDPLPAVAVADQTPAVGGEFAP